MSTLFGIHKQGLDIELEDDCLPEGFDRDDFIEVARRGNNGGAYWINDLASLFHNDMKVYPLDNSAQDVYTIGDLKNFIDKEDI